MGRRRDISDSNGYGEVEPYMNKRTKRMLAEGGPLERAIALAGTKYNIIQARQGRKFREKYNLPEDEVSIGRRALDALGADLDFDSRDNGANIMKVNCKKIRNMFKPKRRPLNIL